MSKNLNYKCELNHKQHNLYNGSWFVMLFGSIFIFRIQFISFQLPINTIECNRFHFFIPNKNTPSHILTSFYFSLFSRPNKSLFHISKHTSKSNNKKTCLFNKRTTLVSSSLNLSTRFWEGCLVMLFRKILIYATKTCSMRREKIT